LRKFDLKNEILHEDQTIREYL